MALFMSLILGSGFVAFPSNFALAQNYGYGNNNSDNLASDTFYSDRYSQYATDDKKYECRTGPLEGFFVSSVEFCKFKFDKDDKKDGRDNNLGTQGPEGPKGDTGETGATGPEGPKGDTGATGATGLPGKSIVGPPGEDGAQGLRGLNGADGADGADGIDGKNGMNGENGIDGEDGMNGRNGENGIDGMDGKNGTDGTNGTKGDPSITFLNGTNLYRVFTDPVKTPTTGTNTATATALCLRLGDLGDTNDFAISGDAVITENADDIVNTFISQPTPAGTAQPANGGWMVTIQGGTNTNSDVEFRAVALCYDNP